MGEKNWEMKEMIRGYDAINIMIYRLAINTIISESIS